MVQNIVDMGFSRARVEETLRRVRCYHVCTYTSVFAMLEVVLSAIMFDSLRRKLQHPQAAYFALLARWLYMLSADVL